MSDKFTEFNKFEDIMKNNGFEDHVRKAKYHGMLEVIKKNNFNPISTKLLYNLIDDHKELSKLDDKEFITEILHVINIIQLTTKTNCDVETVQNIKDYLQLNIKNVQPNKKI